MIISGQFQTPAALSVIAHWTGSNVGPTVGVNMTAVRKIPEMETRSPSFALHTSQASFFVLVSISPSYLCHFQ
jgi:hypothetical protein